MTFNLRAPEPDDGQNGWRYRKSFAAQVIRDAAPDLLGTQEPLIHQVEDLGAALPEYGWVGSSRFGDRLDKYNAIFYRREALRLVRDGQFWLSGEPDRPGSNTWRLTKPRFVTWAEFADAIDRRLFAYSTHFPYRSTENRPRLASARLLDERVAPIPQDCAAVVMGDFNCGADSPPHRVLCANLADAWTTAGKRFGPAGTAHGFHGRPSSRRIDWILYRGLPAPARVATITTNFDGRFPSDHFPVLAEFSNARA